LTTSVNGIQKYPQALTAQLKSVCVFTTGSGLCIDINKLEINHLFPATVEQ
jgi:hypothetical protein